MMNRICIFTCITGEYDTLIEIKNKEEGIDYICYTNNKNIKSKTWKIIYIQDDNLSNALLNRKIKILGTDELKKYDLTMYMDGQIEFSSSIKEFIEKYVDLENYDIVGFRHHSRKNIKEEMIANFRCNKESSDKLLKLQEFYNNIKYPDETDLVEATILFRNFNNDLVNESMSIWFDMLLKYTHRDQLTFPYVIWKTNLKIKLLDINIWDNEYFKALGHCTNGDLVCDSILIDNNRKIHKIDINIDSNLMTIECNNLNKDEEIMLNIKSNKFIIIDYPKNIPKTIEVSFYNCLNFDNKLYFGNNGIIKIKILRKKDEFKYQFNYSFKNDMDVLILKISNEIEKRDNIIKFNESLISERDNIIKYNEFLIKEKEEKLNTKENENDELNSKLDKIYNSKSWKILEKIRKIRRAFKKK